MNQSWLTGQRLVGAFLLGCALLNFPLLQLFVTWREVLGIPMLFVYIFCVWAALIVLMAAVIELRGDSR
ncbi:MAG: hypothetical protein HY778_18250 [Betaproteobacteria bacterium]|nr:hypothetical protein [Betaproteobacteria bacterium]